MSVGGGVSISYTVTYDHGGEGDYPAARVDPALGSWSYSPDALGDVLSYQDAKGQQFKMQYDGLGRPIWREDWTNASSGITCVEPGVTNNTCETNTSWTWGVTPSSHDVGQMDQAQTITSDGTYIDQRSYDGDGRLSTRAVTIPGDAKYTYSYAYNPQGLLGTLQYPAGGSYSGPKLTYGYTNGVLASVTDANAGTVYWRANAVNGLGQVTEDTLGNGIVTERTFLPTSGLLTKAISGPSAGSATVQNQSYLYDPLGNVIQRQQTLAGNSLTENFIYDSDNRIKSSQLIQALLVIDEKYSRSLFTPQGPARIVDHGDTWSVTFSNAMVYQADKSWMPLVMGYRVSRRLTIAIRNTNAEVVSIT